MSPRGPMGVGEEIPLCCWMEKWQGLVSEKPERAPCGYVACAEPQAGESPRRTMPVATLAPPPSPKSFPGIKGPQERPPCLLGLKNLPLYLSLSVKETEPRAVPITVA